MSDHRGVRLRATAALVAAICAVLITTALAAAPASAEPSGVLTGRVTQAGVPVAGVCVEIYGPAYGFTVTEADGRYELTGVPAGSYRVRFDDCNRELGFPTEYYSHATRETARLVAVTGGATTAGIDTDLPAGGSISGRVTGAGGVPLDGICVRARDFGSFRPSRTATTGADGRYLVTGLLQDAYYVVFLDCEQRHDVAGEYYDNARTDILANFVEVPQGLSVTGIDAELARYGRVAGTVSGPGLERLGCTATAHDRDGGRLGSAVTAADGRYLIEQVYPGDVLVSFSCSATTPVQEEWYADRFSAASATRLVVQPGRLRSGVNAVVGAPAAISGRVTGADGRALVDVCAELYEDGAGPLDRAVTGPDGRYRLDDLTQGSFQVRFSDCDTATGRRLRTTWFGGAGDRASAAAVATTAGATRSGVDAVLPVDTTPPDTVVTSGPAEGAIVSGFPVSMGFAASPSEDEASFECRLDGGGWSSCTSPFDYYSLTSGVNVFEVRATDNVGNTDPTPARRSFVYDEGPPDTRITAGPANGATVAGPVTYSFTGLPAIDTTRFECRVDASAWTGCTSPRTVSGLADGAHSFAVRAVDAYDQADLTPATRSFTVNAAACTSARDSLAAAQAALTTARARQTTAQRALARASGAVRKVRAALKQAPRAKKSALKRKLRVAVQRQKAAAQTYGQTRAEVSKGQSSVAAGQEAVAQNC